ncbi:glycosyltransferase family 4 protein [Deltaproteobacteria bacterium]|nr:glycosyltransferase family 4 protein [Deltaproteobacteria bacterium]
MNTIAIISNQAFSLINFRGPLIKALVAEGTLVYALAPDYSDDLRLEVKLLGAEPIDYNFARTGMNPVMDCFNMFRLAILLRRLRPDVTFSYFIKPVIFGTLAAWLALVPYRVSLIAGLGYVFTDSSEGWSRKRLLLRAGVSWLYQLALGRAQRVVFQNEDDINEFVQAGLVAATKVIHISGTGVDLNQWTASPPCTQPITFLLAARLLLEKGIGQYADAARQIKAQYPEVRFVLLGGLDPNPGSLQNAEVQAWVEEGLLEWPGHVPVQPWLMQTSVYVLPSYREGLPRSTQEAMAMGRAVITTDAPGCRETVDDGVNGFLVSVRDVNALVAAMLRFIENPDLIESMGQQSRRLAEERFDVRRINAKLLEVLGLSVLD